MALFDSPNDIQWQGRVDSFKRESTQVYIGKIVDERGDGNYSDNLFQKYTVELLGWGTRLYNCKVLVDYAGYNGTGNYKNYRAGDAVLVQSKEGQLDEGIIIGSVRLNGDHEKLEVEGVNQKYGEHYVGPRNKIAPSNPPSYHPARITKSDSDIYIGGVNNVENEYQDPTELGTLEDKLEKQYIPGIVKTTTREGVDLNYSYGGILQMTDGNFVVLSSGTSQNKCTKYLKQAERHNKIAEHLAKLSQFTSNTSINIQDLNFEDVEVSFTDLDIVEASSINTFNPNASFSILEDTPFFNTSTGASLSTVERNSKEGEEFKSDRANIPVEETIEDSTTKDTTGLDMRDTSYRYKKHLELAKIAKQQAEECNMVGASYQYSASLLGNQVGRPLATQNGVSPVQSSSHVNPNNYSSRNSSFPKPPTVIKPAHPTNYSNREHKLKWLVLHHSVSTMEQMTKDFQSPSYKASAHYAVGRDGLVVQYVPDNKIAWHVKSQNTGKIGIEIVATKPNHGMTQAQEKSLIQLCKFIINTYNISFNNIKGHNYFMATECPTWVFPTKESLSNWANSNLK